MKRTISVLLCAALLTCCIAPVAAEPAYTYLLLRPDSFDQLGSWAFGDWEGAYEDTLLISSNYTAKAPATKRVLGLEGEYTVWVRSRDFPDDYNGSGNLAGQRNFRVLVNGVPLEKDQSLNNPEMADEAHTYAPDLFGTHLYDRFAWEKSASPVSFTGDDVIALERNISNYARVDAVLITNDPAYVPPYTENSSHEPLADADFKELVEICTIPYVYEDQLAFPDYACAVTGGQEAAVLDNGKVQVRFFTNDDGTHRFIQRQTTVDGIQADSREDGLGYLLLYAQESAGLDNGYYYPITTQTFAGPDGTPIQKITPDIYRSGIPLWMIPDSLEEKDGGVLLKAENEYATLEAFWTLPEGAAEPKVTVTLTTKKDGAYSLGMFNKPKGVSYGDTAYIFSAPFYQELRYSATPHLIAEAYSPTSHAQVTVKSGTSGLDKEVTYGIMADPDSVKHRWAYMDSSLENYYGSTAEDTQFTYHRDLTEEQSDFGLGITGYNRKDITPSLFAPLMGSVDCAFSKGDTFTFSYRPVTTVSAEGEGWYDAYCHVANDIWGVYDYRDNYFGSLTDAAFNVYDLLLDDTASGWDENAKAHYNMEGKDVVSVGNPLSYVQQYLLTEDEEMLNRRTIPTLEYMLSRKGLHFAYAGPLIESANVYYDENDPAGILGYQDIGPNYTVSDGVLKRAVYGNTGFGTTTYAGLYFMTNGLMPFWKEQGQTGRTTYITKPEEIPEGASISNMSDAKWQYALDGFYSTLQKMEKQADDYVDFRVNTLQKTPVAYEKFIYIDYYPQLHALLDAYEQTGKQEYLDAAQESARRLISTLWISPMPEPGAEMTVYNDDVMGLACFIRGNSMFYRGSERYRVGIVEELRHAPTDYSSYKLWPVGITDTAQRQDESPVPEWVLSRVGLGIEQMSTFMGGFQKNIMMSTWAPDLIRIAKLTGDQTIETAARNSLIGRFEGFPGYYYNKYMTVHAKKETVYTGPDITQYYYHHMPVFLAAIQDFLFSQAWSWSDGAVDFPNVRNQGYAWFNNRAYGFQPGRVYEETEMWPWLKKGTITVDNQQIDWIGARKDGRCAFSLMNEDGADQRVTVTAGAELGALAAQAKVYAQDGTVSYLPIEDGKISLTVPGKEMMTIAFDAEGVTSPSFASLDIEKNKQASGEGTSAEAEIISDGVEGTSDVFGYTIQLAPEEYFAYIYTTHKPYITGENSAGEPIHNDGDCKGAVLRYRLSGETETKTMTDSVYPYEFTVPVPAGQTISYQVTLLMEDGTQRTMETENTLNALDPEKKTEENRDVKLVWEKDTKTFGFRYGSINGQGAKSIDRAGTYFAWGYYQNVSGSPLEASIVFAFYDQDGRFVKILDRQDYKYFAADATVRVDTLFEADDSMIGGSIKIFALNGFSQDAISPLGESILLP